MPTSEAQSLHCVIAILRRTPVPQVSGPLWYGSTRSSSFASGDDSSPPTPLSNSPGPLSSAPQAPSYWQAKEKSRPGSLTKPALWSKEVSGFLIASAPLKTCLPLLLWLPRSRLITLSLLKRSSNQAQHDAADLIYLHDALPTSSSDRGPRPMRHSTTGRQLRCIRIPTRSRVCIASQRGLGRQFTDPRKPAREPGSTQLPAEASGAGSANPSTPTSDELFE
jgi:hypothetical protein